MSRNHNRYKEDLRVEIDDLDELEEQEFQRFEKFNNHQKKKTENRPSNGNKDFSKKEQED